MSNSTHRKVWPLNQSRTVGTRSCQWLPSTSADPARRATHRGGVLSSKRSPPWMIKSTFAASYSLRFVFLFFFFLFFFLFVCFFLFFERCAPREMGTPRWVGAPRCALQEGRLFAAKIHISMRKCVFCYEHVFFQNLQNKEISKFEPKFGWLILCYIEAEFLDLSHVIRGGWGVG